MDLVFVCNTTDVSKDRLHSVDVEGIPLMVAKLEEGYVVSSRICTHKTYDLTKGHYDEGYVTCMLHTSVFDLNDSGEAMNPPATEALDIYKVVVKDDKIYIEI